MLDDPLRGVRHAVNEGRFKDAQSELEQLPDKASRTPEAQLLAAMATWRLRSQG